MNYEMTDEMLDTLIRANPTKSIEIVGYILEEAANEARGGPIKSLINNNNIYNNIEGVCNTPLYDYKELIRLREEYYERYKDDSLVSWLEWVEENE